MSGPVRSVAVVGRDAACWIMALGLHRALWRIGVKVRVVELPSALEPGAVHATLPSIDGLHALLGLPEQALFLRCGAVPGLGQQYCGWSDASFLRGYDVTRPAINDVDFVHFWSLARRQGMRVPFEDFSLAAAAAKQGRVGGGTKGGSARLALGYQFAARAYAALLREGCVAAGLDITPSNSVRIEGTPDRIEAVVLHDGSRVEADLFVDASGAERALAGGMAGYAFESWSHWFPATHAVTAALPPLDPPPPYARFVAASGGWIGLLPNQSFTGLHGRFSGDEERAARLLAEARIKVSTPLSVRRYEAGALRCSWMGNCVAVGDAAATPERIDAVELRLLQIALSSLVAFWPVDRDHMPEASDYDRTITSHLQTIRDFQLAHYHLSTRTDPFWTAARAASMPPELAARIDLFAARGIISYREDDTFLPQDWAAMLIGHGIIPADSDPAVDRTPQEEQIGKVQQLLHIIAQDVRQMPTIADYISAQKEGR